MLRFLLQEGSWCQILTARQGFLAAVAAHPRYMTRWKKGQIELDAKLILADKCAAKQWMQKKESDKQNPFLSDPASGAYHHLNWKKSTSRGDGRYRYNEHYLTKTGVLRVARYFPSCTLLSSIWSQLGFMVALQICARWAAYLDHWIVVDEHSHRLVPHLGFDQVPPLAALGSRLPSPDPQAFRFSLPYCPSQLRVQLRNSKSAGNNAASPDFHYLL